jgi:hypothetical protein
VALVDLTFVAASVVTTGVEIAIAPDDVGKKTSAPARTSTPKNALPQRRGKRVPKLPPSTPKTPLSRPQARSRYAWRKYRKLASGMRDPAEINRNLRFDLHGVVQR